ncbi:MAG: hypothetical protein HKM89_15580, partial [Gemmatimonadales bacterium]|nr:hypothetical protein [Gemmatimonadales bacterium]
PIQPAPETIGATVVLGDSLVGETIELPGDVDEFQLSIPVVQYVNVVVERNTTPIGTLSLVLDGTQTFPLDVGWSNPRGSAVFLLPAGNYRLRVDGSLGGPVAYFGPYRVYLYPIDASPENGPATIAIGDTVTNEEIAPPGDLDLFSFSGSEGQVLNAMLQGTGPSPGSGGFVLSVLVPGAPVPLATVFSPLSAPALSSNQTRRFILPHDGVYHLAIVSGNSGTVGGVEGPYSFAVVSLGTMPEVAPQMIALGDSIGTEIIDFLGDVDEFILQAAPGTEVQVFFTKIGGGGSGVSFHLDVYQPGTLTLIRRAASAGGGQVTGTFAMPVGGEVRLWVFEPRFDSDPSTAFHETGPYSLWVVPINRAPESVSPTVVVGDTISGERIDFVGDIDEFTFAGTAGNSVTAYFQVPFGTIPFGDIVLEVFPPGGTSPLGSVSANNPTPTLKTLSTGVMVLPTTGDYLVRVMGPDSHRGAGEYRFLLE